MCKIVHKYPCYNRGILDFCDGTVACCRGNLSQFECPFSTMSDDQYQDWLQGQQDAIQQLLGIPEGYYLVLQGGMKVQEGDKFLHFSKFDNWRKASNFTANVLSSPWESIDPEDVGEFVGKFAAIIRRKE